MSIRIDADGPSPSRRPAAPFTSLLRQFLATVLMGAASLAFAQADASVATTTYGYDENGSKVRQVDALGRTTTWAFDAKERVTQRALPDGSRETSTYDAADNLLARTTFSGDRLTFQYDLNDRITAHAVPAGSGTNQGVPAASLVLRYTPSGQLAARSERGATSLDGDQSWRYDALDRLVEMRSPIGVISYGRDAAGSMTERSVAGAGTTQYAYDDQGRLIRVVAPDGKQTLYGYDAAGRLDRVERELRERDGQRQALITSYVYDAADRIVLIGHLRQQGAVTSMVAGQRIVRLAGGAITRIETDRGNATSSTSGQATGRLDVIQAFEYDGAARLTRELRTDPGGTTDTRYEYDAAGNRTRKTVTASAGTEITTYAYDVADRLIDEVTTLPAGGSRTTRYTWDGNGNLASKTEPGQVTLYRFDPLNRLIDMRRGATQALAEAAAPHARYAYDADGNRVRKWGAEARTYLIDGEEAFAQVVREVAANESIDYVRGLGLIRQTRTTSAGREDLFPLSGHLGTSLGAVNADGDVVEQVDVDAFGNLELDAPRQTHLYTGEYWDRDAQLLFLRARWYDPRIGRFVSADPFVGLQRDPRSLNRYSYANNDPVHNTDATGLFTLGEMNASINIQLTAVRQAFLTGGRQAGGKALQQLGKIVEEGVEKLVQNCLKPGATITPKKPLTTKGGANAVIDFFGEMGGKVKNIEVKYQLPASSSSGGFARAAKQLQAMIDKGEEGLLFAYKELKSDARAKKLLDSVSGNAGTVQIMEGFVGLGAFLGEMVIEGCIK